MNTNNHDNKNTIINKIELLRQANLFLEVDESGLQKLAEIAELIYLEPGVWLYHQNTAADCLFVLCYGRLSIYRENKELMKYIGEVVPGEAVGEMPFFADKKRIYSVLAGRYCVLLRIKYNDWQGYIEQYPDVLLRLTRIIVARTQKTVNTQFLHYPIKSMAFLSRHAANQHAALCEKFYRVMSGKYKVFCVTKALLVQQNYYTDVPDAMRVEAFFFEKEKEFDYICYDCAGMNVAWMNYIVHHVDRVVILDDEVASQHSFILKQISMQEDLFNKILLVCLHEIPATLQVQKIDPLVRFTFHVFLNENASVARLVRLVIRKGFGLLLGGGAARGFAHIGVLRAFQEKNIPIDVIGGVSSGSIIAAFYAAGFSFAEMMVRSHKIFKNAFIFLRLLSFPAASIYNNKIFLNFLAENFGECRIEELPINFLTFSSDISVENFFTHEKGRLQEAIYASNACPPFLPPATLDGHLHIDGGFLNNIPGEEMRQRFGGTIFGVDISYQNQLFVDKQLQKFPSNSYLLWEAMHPWKKKKYPWMSEFVARAMSLNHFVHLEERKKQCDFYLAPPVGAFSVSDYHKIDQLVEVGYRYTIDYLDELLCQSSFSFSV